MQTQNTLKIPIYSPYLPDHITKYAHYALDDGWISSKGEYIQKATDKLKDILQSEYVILTNNGTTAMHMVASSLGQVNLHKAIIVPNNVYVAAWNVFRFFPNFILLNTDTDLQTWNMNMSDLETMAPIAPSILIVHNLGNIINVPELQQKYPYLTVVEDNCEGFLGKYCGVPSGSASLASAISFYGNKTITSGEGGAFVTSNKSVWEYARRLWGQGRTDDDPPYLHSQLGMNYRLTNISAAILYGNLIHLNEILERKHIVFETYKQELSGVNGISFQKVEDNTEPAEWMFAIRIHGSSYENFDSFMSEAGVETRPFFKHIMAHEHMRGYWKNNDNARLLEKEVVILPSFPTLTENNIKFICDKIKKYVEDNNYDK